MNSSELGSLAGVTVRALRHYHQVGVLDEPPRGPNGYR
ncbi:MerR family DNA-binding transcriptional regulator [Streptosporangium amethystogenes]|nr:MerR family DNA-binding transcriptional regulator [Streptosporangium amethystogenes]